MFTDDVIVYILFPVVAKLLFVFHVVQCPGGVETNKSHSFIQATSISTLKLTIACYGAAAE